MAGRSHWTATYSAAVRALGIGNSFSGPPNTRRNLFAGRVPCRRTSEVGDATIDSAPGRYLPQLQGALEAQVCRRRAGGFVMDALRAEIQKINRESRKAKRLPAPKSSIATDATGITPSLDAYYDSARGCYWSPNSRKGWITINETSLKRRLRAAGVSARRGEAEAVSPLEKMLIEIQNEHDVDYAGPLAGFNTGVYQIQGR